jgi:hypothetical protein
VGHYVPCQHLRISATLNLKQRTQEMRPSEITHD